MRFRVESLPEQIAEEVRRTRRSPGYGHPVHSEIATGTGPCRSCLRPFVPGVERRLLFTYRPAPRGETLHAPGPVFIHEEACPPWTGSGFPDALRPLPLAFEGRASGSRVTALSWRDDGTAEARIAELFARDGTEWLHVRHADAGCFIATVVAEADAAVERPRGA